MIGLCSFNPLLVCFLPLCLMHIHLQPEIRGFPPPALRGHTANLIGHKIFLFGGFDGKSRTNEVYILDTRTRSWLLVPDVSPSSPFSSSQPGESSAITTSRLATKRTCETAQEGDEDGRHSRGRVSDATRGALRSSNANSSIIPSTTTTTTTTTSSTVCSSAHRRTISSPPPARQSHSAALVGNRKVFIFGGFDGFRWLNDLYILDTSHFEEDVLHESTVRQFVENMRTLVNSPDFSDVVLVVEGRDICAHKCILAANCEFFRQMFAGNMMESRQSHITIPGWSYDAYIAMIEFLYTGKLSDTRTHVACEVGLRCCRSSSSSFYHPWLSTPREVSLYRREGKIRSVEALSHVVGQDRSPYIHQAGEKKSV